MLAPCPRVPRASGPSPRSARLAVVAVLSAVSLLAAGCDGTTTPGRAEQSRPDSQPIAGGRTLAALWPLTGEPVRGRTPRRPVLVAKIDNTPSSRPQLGLDGADLVTEELVEGGITRLAVFFYQRLPAVVGPVRSMRASDIGLVEPAHGVLVASGAAPPTLRRLDRAGVPYYEEDTGAGYYRDGARVQPYDLMVRLPRLAAAARKEAVVPASYLPWGTEKQFAGAQRATGVQAVFSPTHTTTWTYRGGRYRDLTGFAAPGRSFDPDSVLVLRVRERDAGYLDPAGNRVPETVTTGSGPAVLFHRGRVVRGTWSKSSTTATLRLRTRAGRLTVPAGRTWIELVPRDGAGGRVTWNR